MCFQRHRNELLEGGLQLLAFFFEEAFFKMPGRSNTRWLFNNYQKIIDIDDLNVRWLNRLG